MAVPRPFSCMDIGAGSQPVGLACHMPQLRSSFSIFPSRQGTCRPPGGMARPPGGLHVQCRPRLVAITAYSRLTDLASATETRLGHLACSLRQKRPHIWSLNQARTVASAGEPKGLGIWSRIGAGLVAVGAGIGGVWKNEGKVSAPDALEIGGANGPGDGGYEGGGGGGDGGEFEGGGAGSDSKLDALDTDEEQEDDELEGHRPVKRFSLEPCFAHIGHQPVGTEKQDDHFSEEVTQADENKHPAEHNPLEGVAEWMSGFMHQLQAVVGFRNQEEANESIPSEAELLELTAQRIMEVLLERSGDDAITMRSETLALKRLQREAFEELLRLKERLEKVEHHTGLAKGRGLSQESFGALLAGLSRRTKFWGTVSAGGALLRLEEEMVRGARSALEQAGLLTGTNLELTFETTFRKHDILQTKLVAGDCPPGGPSGGSLALQKILYKADFSDWLTLRGVAFGADGSDMAETNNPLQGLALTKFASNGSPLLSHCKGSAVGGTVQLVDGVSLSAAHYFEGWANQGGGGANGGEPLSHSTVGQLNLRVERVLALALTAVTRFWPTPPLPSTAGGLHWTELGPLIIPVLKPTSSMSNSPLASQPVEHPPVHNGDNSNWRERLGEAAATSARAGAQAFGVSGAVALGGVATVGGWGYLERADWAEADDTRGLQWGLSLALGSTSQGPLWGLSVGTCKPDIWRRALSPNGSPQASGSEFRSSDSTSSSTQLVAEGFVRLECSRGFTMTPGVGYIRGRSGSTPAIMLRSEWQF